MTTIAATTSYQILELLDPDLFTDTQVRTPSAEVWYITSTPRNPSRFIDLQVFLAPAPYRNLDTPQVSITLVCNGIGSAPVAMTLTRARTYLDNLAESAADPYCNRIIYPGNRIDQDGYCEEEATTMREQDFLCPEHARAYDQGW